MTSTSPLPERIGKKKKPIKLPIQYFPTPENIFRFSIKLNFMMTLQCLYLISSELSNKAIKIQKRSFQYQKILNNMWLTNKTWVLRFIGSFQTETNNKNI